MNDPFIKQATEYLIILHDRVHGISVQTISVRTDRYFQTIAMSVLSAEELRGESIRSITLDEAKKTHNEMLERVKKGQQ